MILFERGLLSRARFVQLDGEMGISYLVLPLIDDCTKSPVWLLTVDASFLFVLNSPK